VAGDVSLRPRDRVGRRDEQEAARPMRQARQPSREALLDGRSTIGWPKHPCAAADDAFTAYEALLGLGIAPSDIAMAGESQTGRVATTRP
jgi:hypothetical protein